MLDNSFRDIKLWQCTAIFTVVILVGRLTLTGDDAANEPLWEFVSLTEDFVPLYTVSQN